MKCTKNHAANLASSLAVTFVAILSASILNLTTSDEAFGYTELCVGSSKVYKVKTEIAVPGGKMDRFMHALHRFSDEKGYFYLIDTADPKKMVDGFLVKKGTDEGIHIQVLKSDVITAEMTECGSEKFRPYWKEFLDFVRRFEFIDKK